MLKILEFEIIRKFLNASIVVFRVILPPAPSLFCSSCDCEDFLSKNSLAQGSASPPSSERKVG